jgi:uncharacterized protein YdeI (YjbR/CyaY-like superfamily)
MVDITETFHAPDRAAWRAWLSDNHTTAKEIWLIAYDKETGVPSVSYLDSVLEAICFGWIDGIAKRMDSERRAQRFTPRRPKGNWTELNKERARRLIEAGLMTDAGGATLPDLTIEAFTIAPDILAALQEDPQLWANFQAFPPLYQRIRVGNIEEQRKNPELFQKKLANFLSKTRDNKMYGGME